jgi:hypothetical protein
VFQAPAADAAPESLIPIEWMKSRALPLLLMVAAATASLLFLQGCGLDLSGERKQQVEAHLNRASKLYEARDYLGAIATYEKLLRLDPGRQDVHFKIAQIYYGNLNDYLNAAYHYQKFLNSPDPESGTAGLAKGYLENAKLLLAATVPNSGVQGSAELVKLRTENQALHNQIDDLKKEMAELRVKPLPLHPSFFSVQTASSTPQQPSLIAHIEPNANKAASAPVIPLPTPEKKTVESSAAPTVDIAPDKPVSSVTSTNKKVSPLSIDYTEEKVDVPPARPATTKPPATKSTSRATASASRKSTRTAPKPRRTYVVRKGEGIQSIAERVYGDRSQWRKIMSANPGVKDPDKLSPGQVLILP